MPVCAICLEPGSDEGRYHRACLQRLFGAPTLPRVDLDLATFPARVQATHDRMSVSGVQRKALLVPSGDRGELLLADHGSSLYILKPQTERFPSVPENEHLSMCIAGALGLLVPPFGLVPLRDDSWAYVVRRFDRTSDDPPRKHRQFDLCQLLGRSPEHKADGHAEECADIVRQHTVDPQASLRALFQLFLVSFWIGNGDLHLKNISLLADLAGRYSLSPVYDLLCTAIYGIHPQLLGVSGRRHDLTRTHFVQFGERACGLPRDLVHQTIDALCGARDRVTALIDRSFLPPQHKGTYKQTIAKRTRALRAPP